MIIVAGHIEVLEANADRAAELARAMMTETRKEAGCRVYDLTRSIEHPGRFHVYEEWDDLAALEAHFATPHMAAFRAGLAEVNVLARSIVRMETAGEPAAL